ncbi:hypothetical protein [Vibrio maerlii]|uniref:hypothetical protein n=1 Tax=Vibrio maerlii TaxID=2231648 RepID=UPI000E3E39EC|nr:hypothetical protein [Vibrio maerlii]
MKSTRTVIYGTLVIVFVSVLAFQYRFFKDDAKVVEQHILELKKVNRSLQDDITIVTAERDAQHENWILLSKKVEKQSEVISSQSQQISRLEGLLANSEKRSKEYQNKYNNQRAESQKAQLAYEERYQQDKQNLEVQTNKQLQEKLQALESEYSDVATIKEKEERVDELMEEFTDLKVSLDVMNVCDKSYVERYNQAKGMLSHMRTYLRQHELNKDFYHFVILNDAQITQQAREVCIEPV